RGIQVIQEFFGVALAQTLSDQSLNADLIVANNVLAHVPDINDFVSGVTILLSKKGVATFEFPHLYNLVLHNQFDTIYHEHYSYLCFTAVVRIFDRNGLAVFDVEEIPTHGGSLRVYAQRREGAQRRSWNVASVLERESTAGLSSRAYYAG